MSNIYVVYVNHKILVVQTKFTVETTTNSHLFNVAWRPTEPKEYILLLVDCPWILNHL